MIAQVSRRDHIACRQGAEHKANPIVTRRQIGEAIVTACVGGRGSDGIPTAVQQFYRHIRHAIFAAILETVTIGVIPNPVTDGSRLIDPQIPTAVVFTRVEHSQNGAPGGWIDITVKRIITTLILGANKVANRRGEEQTVTLRQQPGEEIEATVAGCGSADDRAIRVE